MAIWPYISHLAIHTQTQTQTESEAFKKHSKITKNSILNWESSNKVTGSRDMKDQLWEPIAITITYPHNSGVNILKLTLVSFLVLGADSPLLCSSI